MKKNIFAIIGSASQESSNRKLVERLAEMGQADLKITIFDRLSDLPHFDPVLSINQPPPEVMNFRSYIQQADGVIICTPEYIFSIPSRLKNAIEWCVSTTVFSQKPVGIITASGQGIKGHAELKLIMKTLEARFNEQTSLLIQGIKGKMTGRKNSFDMKTEEGLVRFLEAYKDLIRETGRNNEWKTGSI